jgi:hypothetical protein
MHRARTLPVLLSTPATTGYGDVIDPDATLGQQLFDIAV